jgi:hypothetical protein
VGPGVGFAGDVDACWLSAVLALETKARMITKTIRISGCIKIQEGQKASQHNRMLNALDLADGESEQRHTVQLIVAQHTYETYSSTRKTCLIFPLVPPALHGLVSGGIRVPADLRPDVELSLQKPARRESFELVSYIGTYLFCAEKIDFQQNG